MEIVYGTPLDSLYERDEDSEVKWDAQLPILSKSACKAKPPMWLTCADSGEFVEYDEVIGVCLPRVTALETSETASAAAIV